VDVNQPRQLRHGQLPEHLPWRQRAVAGRCRRRALLRHTAIAFGSARLGSAAVQGCFSARSFFALRAHSHGVSLAAAPSEIRRGRLYRWQPQLPQVHPMRVPPPPPYPTLPTSGTLAAFAKKSRESSARFRAGRTGADFVTAARARRLSAAIVALARFICARPAVIRTLNPAFRTRNLVIRTLNPAFRTRNLVIRTLNAVFRSNRAPWQRGGGIWIC